MEASSATELGGNLCFKTTPESVGREQLASEAAPFSFASFPKSTMLGVGMVRRQSDERSLAIE